MPKDTADRAVLGGITTNLLAAVSSEGIEAEGRKNKVTVETVMSGGGKEYEDRALRKRAINRFDRVVDGAICTQKIMRCGALVKHRAVPLNCFDARCGFPVFVGGVC